MIIIIIFKEEWPIANYSKQREMVYKYLQSHRSHPKAEEIYEELKKDYPNLSLATVYRNLHYFENTGDIISIPCKSGKCSFDYDTSEHYHFECTVCNRVYDLMLPPLGSINDAAETVGEPESLNLVVYGICKNCKQ